MARNGYRREPAHAHARDAALFGFDDLHVKAIDLEVLPDRRYTAETRQQKPADGLETLVRILLSSA